MTVRPVLLGDTTAVPGYDHLDPISQWFLGGSGTAGAEATGISDDNRYGLDLQNSGSGGRSLRATSGNGTYQLKIDNTSAAISGGFTVTGGISVTGTTTFSSPVTMLSSLSVTGAAAFSTGVTVGGSLGVTGAAMFSTGVTMLTTLNVTGGVVFGSSLVVTGPANFVTSVTMQGSLGVDGNTTLGNGTGDTVYMAGSATIAVSLQVQDSVNIANDLTVVSNLDVTGSAVILGDLTISGSGGFGNSSTDAHYFNGTVSFNQALTCNGEVNMSGAVIDFDTGSASGFDINVDTAGVDHINFDGYITIKHDGDTKYVPYLSTAP